MKTAKKPTLPKKPSELLTLALADLEKVEKDKRYRVNMSNWQTVRDKSSRDKTKVCEVCLGGAVLAKTLNFPFGEYFEYSESYRFHKQLHALDHMRNGNVASALSVLGHGDATVEQFMHVGFHVYPYDLHKGKFKAAMRSIVRSLVAADL